MTVFLLPTASMASTKGLQTPVNAMSTRFALKEDQRVPLGRAMTQQSISPFSSIRRTSSALRFS